MCPATKRPSRKCDHTVHLTGERGQPIGSWVEQKHGNSRRVVCMYCGRFYGYVIAQSKTQVRGRAVG